MQKTSGAQPTIEKTLGAGLYPPRQFPLLYLLIYSPSSRSFGFNAQADGPSHAGKVAGCEMIIFRGCRQAEQLDIDITLFFQRSEESSIVTICSSASSMLHGQ